MALLTTVGAGHRHLALDRAEPAPGAVVAAPPALLRLVFTEAVDAVLAELVLEPAGADPVPLRPEAGEVAEEIRARVPSGLPAGGWTVRWRVVGADGHPVRGEYAFAVRTAGLEAPAAAPVAAFQDEEEEEGLTVESPAFVAARWLTFAAMLTVIGAVAFQYLVVLPARARQPALAAAVDAGGAVGARLGYGAGLFLALAAGVRLLLQIETLGGADMELVRDMVLRTSWGWAWLMHLAGALVAMAGFRLVMRGWGGGWVVAAVATLLVSFGASLSSHAAATDLAVIAVTADALHVLAVSGWLGGLLVLAGVGIPAVLAEDPRTGRFSAVSALVSAFSPRALVMAAIGVVTGIFGGILHLPEVASLWTTPYGRTLSIKVGLVVVAAAIGAVNWRRMKPGLEAGDPPDRLRRTAAVELIAAALVLLATAVLVALPTP